MFPPDPAQSLSYVAGGRAGRSSSPVTRQLSLPAKRTSADLVRLRGRSSHRVRVLPNLQHHVDKGDDDRSLAPMLTRSFSSFALELALVISGVVVTLRFSDQSVVVDLPKFVAADPNFVSRSAGPVFVLVNVQWNSMPFGVFSSLSNVTIMSGKSRINPCATSAIGVGGAPFRLIAPFFA